MSKKKKMMDKRKNRKKQIKEFSIPKFCIGFFRKRNRNLNCTIFHFWHTVFFTSEFDQKESFVGGRAGLCLFSCQGSPWTIEFALNIFVLIKSSCLDPFQPQLGGEKEEKKNEKGRFLFTMQGKPQFQTVSLCILF